MVQPNLFSSTTGAAPLMGGSFVPQGNVMGQGMGVLPAQAAPRQSNNVNDLLSDFGNLDLHSGTQNNNLLNSGSLLMPTSAQTLQPMSSTTNNNSDKPQKSQPIGQTWTNSGNLKIDLDNLLVSKPKQGPSPSMNQLASNPTSPVNQPRISQKSQAFETNQSLNNQNLSGFNQLNNDLFASFK